MILGMENIDFFVCHQLHKFSQILYEMPPVLTEGFLSEFELRL